MLNIYFVLLSFQYNIFDIVCDLRKQRHGMIQTKVRVVMFVLCLNNYMVNKAAVSLTGL